MPVSVKFGAACARLAGLPGGGTAARRRGRGSDHAASALAEQMYTGRADHALTAELADLMDVPVFASGDITYARSHRPFLPRPAPPR